MEDLPEGTLLESLAIFFQIPDSALGIGGTSHIKGFLIDLHLGIVAGMAVTFCGTAYTQVNQGSGDLLGQHSKVLPTATGPNLLYISFGEHFCCVAAHFP